MQGGPMENCHFHFKLYFIGMITSIHHTINHSPHNHPLTAHFRQPSNTSHYHPNHWRIQGVPSVPRNGTQFFHFRTHFLQKSSTSEVGTLQWVGAPDGRSWICHCHNTPTPPATTTPRPQPPNTTPGAKAVHECIKFHALSHIVYPFGIPLEVPLPCNQSVWFQFRLRSYR